MSDKKKEEIPVKMFAKEEQPDIHAVKQRCWKCSDFFTDSLGSPCRNCGANQEAFLDGHGEDDETGR